VTKREAEGGGGRAGAGGWRRRGAARLQIGDSRFQKEEFRSQVAEGQGLGGRCAIADGRFKISKRGIQKSGVRRAGAGGAARLQMADSRFQKEELRRQKSKTNVSGEHLLPLARGGEFGSAPGVVPQSGIATSILNV